MANIVPIRSAKEAPKTLQSKMETIIVSRSEAERWHLPVFQRPLRVNDKVKLLAEQMKSTECIEGVVTLGRLPGDPILYLVDGQHRRESFLLSGLTEVIVDVRVLSFKSLAEMADEFTRLNSKIVNFGPDDILRGMEQSCRALQGIRKSCEFVGYDNIRRGTDSPIIGMSILLRSWAGSAFDTPVAGVAGKSAAALAEALTSESTDQLVQFLQLARTAWGRDAQNYRLWAALNLTICMWLWRRLVLDKDRSGNRRYAVLSAGEFKQCLMSLSADDDYVPWLLGRKMGDRDRSPCYSRIKQLFVRRLQDVRGSKERLPQPEWASS